LWIDSFSCKWRWRRRRRRRRKRRRRRRSSLLDDPPSFIMTPFLIIVQISSLTELCESFLEHPVEYRFLSVSCLGRKPHLDLTLAEDETEIVIGVLIIVLKRKLYSLRRLYKKRHKSR
jgi:hypothetical protein